MYQWRRISDDSEENYNIHTTLRYKYILIGTSHEALVMNKKERMDVDLKNSRFTKIESVKEKEKIVLINQSNGYELKERGERC